MAVAKNGVVRLGKSEKVCLKKIGNRYSRDECWWLKG
jgi:hypothetical protein